VAFLFQGFYFMVTNYIFYSKKTYVLSIITITSVIFISILNYFLILKIGILGSAYAMLSIWIFQFLIVFCFSNKIYPMPWRIR